MQTDMYGVVRTRARTVPQNGSTTEQSNGSKCERGIRERKHTTDLEMAAMGESAAPPDLPPWLRPAHAVLSSVGPGSEINFNRVRLDDPQLTTTHCHRLPLSAFQNYISVFRQIPRRYCSSSMLETLSETQSPLTKEFQLSLKDFSLTISPKSLLSIQSAWSSSRLG